MAWLMEFLSANAADLTNGTFEFAGACFIFLSVLKVHRDKIVRGVSWLHVSFFTFWGAWNLFYYPHLDQWFSFTGGLFITTVNTVWVGQLVYWSWKERQ